MKNNNLTISDVAKQVGVSKTTISRYLNGKYEYMSVELRSRIAGVIDDLNYRPSNIARSLKSQKSQLIGVIYADISNPVSAIISKGINDCCKKYGYHVLTANTDNDSEKEKEYILSMIDARVEGLIILPVGSNTELMSEISQKHVPIVLVDRPTFPTRFDTVKTNDFAITVETIRYLSGQGFERIGFFSPPIDSVGTRILRQQAYRKACGDILKIQPQEFVVDDCGDNAAAEIKVQEFMNENSGRRKAIFTSSGVTMLSVIKAIYKLKLQIPEDVGICGFDDWPWAELVGPGITAISQPSYNVGMEAVERMMFRLDKNRNAPPKLIELENRLVIRGSTQWNK